MKKLESSITLERLCKLLKVDSPENYNEWMLEMNSESALDENGDLTEEYERICTAYYDNLINVAEKYFGKCKLVLEKVNYDLFQISPEENWDLAAHELIEVINGYGLFHFDSLEEAIDSGPYETSENFVLHHLGWISSYSEVYGDYSAKYLLDQAMRYV